ncbi:MAG: hypothetical protein EOO24_58555 [Comamonadaceae bacterium]|nr:MAG: hypothetical protein EOO24_58555 [Comamonadaceae bacterium]
MAREDEDLLFDFELLLLLAGDALLLGVDVGVEALLLLGGHGGVLVEFGWEHARSPRGDAL